MFLPKINVKPVSLDTVTCTSWNIGYCGLGANMDFFYDGGNQVRTSEEKTEKNLVFIKDQLNSDMNIQFFTARRGYRFKRKLLY